MAFIELAPGFYVSPQISPADIEKAKALGVSLVINNRPEGEEPGQPTGAAIAEAAARAGLQYIAIPVGPAGVSDSELDAFDAAMKKNAGKTLAFCRSGTRSTVMRALARARAGESAGVLVKEAGEAGYNISGLAPRLDALSKAGR